MGNPPGALIRRLTAKFSIIYLEWLLLEVREESENVTKTLINIANPHIGIYREIGQLVLVSIEKTRTLTHTDVIEIYI